MNTAVLVFAQSASKEASRKNIRSGQSLFKALTNHTLSEVKKAGLPYYHFKENVQEGATFGERFANAVQHLFNKGFENIITIGNDCPQLNFEHLLDTASKLSSGQNVIAPSTDGGFNLLGIQKEAFNKEAFIDFSWQTNGLFNETLTYFRKLGHQPTLLDTLSDLDSLADVYGLLHKVKLSSKKLYLVLKNLVENKSVGWSYSIQRTATFSINLPFNKGSPFLCA